MTDRIEGSGASQLVQLIQKIGYNDYDSISLATVTSSAPALKIIIDGMKIELDAGDLVVSERLTKHKRRVTITNGDSTSISAVYPTQTVSDSYPAGSPASSINFHSLSMNNASFTTTDAEIEYLDELKVGDRVIVSSMNNGQTYVILDRAVSY